MFDSVRQRPLLGVLGFAATIAVLAAFVAWIATSGPSIAQGLADASTAPGPTTVASAASTSSGPTPSPSPSPTPIPTPILVPAPLTGRLVTEAEAQQHPIAVMIDDLDAARPQSGLNAASVVWQAPAEGGIPRYMLIFGEQTPKAVGPVRSARYYYIAWAAEWDALYVHAGGSPQAQATLAAKGNGQLVYNADEFRWGSYFHRIKQRDSPHNLYTDGERLRKLAISENAADGPMKAVWLFAPDAPLEQRPTGGTIQVSYPDNVIKYAYDRTSNSYLRSVTGEPMQVDAATAERVAPKNVVVMLMSFGPLNDGEPNKRRLEAKVVGSGKAWIATNGRTIVGTWRKTALDKPTQFFDRSGQPVTLTIGQTFVQVMPVGSAVLIRDGALPGTASPAPSGALPSPSPNGG